MADQIISGNNCYVALGAQTYSFGKWRLPIEMGTKKFNMMGFGGAQLTTPGGYSATPVVEGPYNVGNMPLTIGALYVLHLGLDVGIEVVLTARLSNVEFSVEVGGSDPAGVSCTFDSHGAFSLSFT